MTEIGPQAELSPAMLRLIEALAEAAVLEDMGLAPVPSEEEFEARENFVYRYFDSAGCLLYVGVTCDPEKRHREHRRKPWFRLAARKTVEAYPTRSQALAAETAAIRHEAPIHNGTPKDRGHERR